MRDDDVKPTTLSKSSIAKLITCESDLQMLVHAVNKRFPVQVAYGERGEKEQNECYKNGTSKLKFPDSKHNINKKLGRFKSHAVDLIPDPDKNPATVDWKDHEQFEIMCLTVRQVADELNIRVRLGEDWGDMPHVELI